MNPEIKIYNNKQVSADKEICDLLAKIIDNELTKAENKIWHSHPVWFLDGNPIVGYSKQKKGIRFMFWSGADFEEENLNVSGEKFKDASIFYNNVSEINTKDIKRWLDKAKKIQWDYKNIVKRKGKLERLNLKNMATINPYIHFNGNAEEAFTFYKTVFGGDFTTIVRFKDMNFEGSPWSEKEAEKIMHIVLPVGTHSLLMGSDTPEQLGKHNEMETRSKISISVESKEEADRIFNGLSKGGQIEMPIEESPWGSYFGMFRDKFGIEWMVDFDPK